MYKFTSYILTTKPSETLEIYVVNAPSYKSYIYTWGPFSVFIRIGAKFLKQSRNFPVNKFDIICNFSKLFFSEKGMMPFFFW